MSANRAMMAILRSIDPVEVLEGVCLNMNFVNRWRSRFIFFFFFWWFAFILEGKRSVRSWLNRSQRLNWLGSFAKFLHERLRLAAHMTFKSIWCADRPAWPVRGVLILASAAKLRCDGWRLFGFARVAWYVLWNRSVFVRFKLFDSVEGTCKPLIILVPVAYTQEVRDSFCYPGRPSLSKSVFGVCSVILLTICCQAAHYSFCSTPSAWKLNNQSTPWEFEILLRHVLLHKLLIHCLGLSGLTDGSYHAFMGAQKRCFWWVII